jgi:hypothetical protein
LNRLWLAGGLLVLAIAGVIGWLNAGREAQLVDALILADVSTPGCDGPGQVHLVLGNAAARSIARVEGVLSISAPGADQPTPMGNFELAGPVAPGAKVDACVAFDEARLAGRDRASLTWLARATAVEFTDATP